MIRIEIGLLEENMRQLEVVDSYIKQMYEETHPSKNIESIKGIGEKLGASIFSVISNPHRFPSQSKFRGFTEIIPKQDESGDRSKKGLSITKEGPKRLRRDLYIAADVAR